MNKCTVIGLMSGTSLDGLDIACVDFTLDDVWTFDVIQCETVAYDSELSSRLRTAAELSAFELKQLDVAYGTWIGEKVKIFMIRHNISPDLIASHGHTIFHQPDIGLTLQIGDGYQIMLKTNVKTICDFRSLDVANGGQGAPLVPIGDKFLFSNYDICLNLGGFSNVSMDIDGERIAFDICAVNTVFNHLSSRLGMDFDRDGDIARSGTINHDILRQLNALPYYKQQPPKSLGIEWVEKQVFPLLINEKTDNLLTTFSRHIAQQIADAIPGKTNVEGHISKMLVTGGGARNHFLLSLIKKELDRKVAVEIPEDQLIDFKEAVIFGFLGLLRDKGEVNALKSVTGAKRDSSCGIIYDCF
jgi:anhydro-N-acetylmuramic acid kinase